MAENLFEEFDLFIDAHVKRPYKDFSSVVIPPGNLAKVRSYLALDEWTYLTGVPCRSDQVDSLIAKWGTVDRRLDHTHFAFLEENRGFAIVWIDGWWECFFADNALFQAIHFGGHKGITETKKWTTGTRRRPEFRAEQSHRH